MKKTLRRIEKKKPVRYGAVSSLSTGLDIGIYALLTLGGLHAVAANFLSTTAGFCVSFFVNRAYTFDTTDQSVKRQILLFTVITLFGLWVIQPGVILLFKYFYSDNLTWSITLLAKLTALPITMVYNYLLYSKVVFKPKKKESDPSTSDT